VDWLFIVLDIGLFGVTIYLIVTYNSKTKSKMKYYKKFGKWQKRNAR